MNTFNRFKFLTLVFLATSSLVGCATQITEKPSTVTRSTIPLAEFERVILVKTEIAPAYAKHPANIRAVNKIDEVLTQNVTLALNNVEVKTKSQLEALQLIDNPNVLIIKPYVKQIKFISGAARFWAGAMAGSSVVIMDVAFLNGSDGQQLSNPGFMRTAGAYTDAFGVASNKMLVDVAQDTVNYINMNR